MNEQHGGCDRPESGLAESFPELAAALRARTEAIVRRWVQKVRNSIPSAAKLDEAQILDQLPSIFPQWARALDSRTGQVHHDGDGAHHALRDADGAPRRDELGLRQGMNRFHLEYTIQELLYESRLLRPILTEQLEDALGRPMCCEEQLALHEALDMLVQQMTVAHVTEQNHRIREAADAEARYFAYLSHDLKNNMNGILLVLESHRRHLQGHQQFTGEFEEDLRALGAAMESIAATTDGVDRLLRAERLRSGIVQPRRQRVRLREVVADVTRQTSLAAAQKGIALVVEVPPGAMVHSDREWVIVVLQNLLGNAVKYTPGGTVRLCATASATPHGRRWTISVIDQGPGIAPEHLRHIFNAFRRGETHGQQGMGLGLAIAWHAARLMRADLTAESQPGAGSTFSLAFPPEPSECPEIQMHRGDAERAEEDAENSMEPQMNTDKLR